MLQNFEPFRHSLVDFGLAELGLELVMLNLLEPARNLGFNRFVLGLDTFLKVENFVTEGVEDALGQLLVWQGQL